MPNRPSIVAAVDLDTTAAGIVRRAANLAARCDGYLTIAHFVDYQPGYESDQVPLVAGDQVRNQMIRYARAWLVGLACHLEVAEPEIVVEAMRPIDGLTALADKRRPNYMVVGRSRWGRLSPLSDLAKRLQMRGNDCGVLIVARKDATGDGIARPIGRARIETIG